MNTTRAFLITVLLFAGAITVSAQSETSSSTASTTAEATTTPIVEVTPVAPVAVDDIRLTLSPTAQTRITNLTANISNQLDAQARRLTNVTARLNSRIEKMAAEGKDVENARTALSTATSELARAQGLLSSIDTQVAAFVGSDNPRTRWQTLRSTYTDIHSALRSSHSAAGQCILLLQGAQVIPPPTADTSTTTPAL